MANPRYSTYSIADIAGRMDKSDTTVRKYIKNGDLGNVTKGDMGFYRVPKGAIGALMVKLENEAADRKHKIEVQDLKKNRKYKEDKKKLLFIRKYTMHEAEDLASRLLKEEVEKHSDAWSRELDEKEIEFRKSTLYQQFLYKLLSETDGVPRDELSDAEKRIALHAPIFMADTLARMSSDDMAYFLGELKLYYDIGYEIDKDPRLSFIVNQIILEQMRLRHRQTLLLAQEYSIDKDLDDSVSRSMTLLDKLFKMLGDRGEPKPPVDSGTSGGQGKSGDMK